MSILPAGFEPLAPFVARWSLPDLADRAAARAAFPEIDRDAFYAAAHPLLPKALDLLGGRPLTALDEAESRLLDLMLTLAHVAMAVEVYQEAELPHIAARSHMRLTSQSWRAA